MTSRRNVIYLPPSPEYPSLVADVRADGKILFAIAAPKGEDPQEFAAQLAKDEETIKTWLRRGTHPRDVVSYDRITPRKLTSRPRARVSDGGPAHPGRCSSSSAFTPRRFKSPGGLISRSTVTRAALGDCAVVQAVHSRNL